jgi:hypothetical protein
MIEQPVQFETLSANKFTAVNSSLTSVNINFATINSLQAPTGSITNLYVQNLTADYFVTNVITNYLFTPDDNSKAFHFNTTTNAASLCAIFPSSLPIGFNVSIYNVSNDSQTAIALSSNGVDFFTPGTNVLPAPPQNSTPFTGMFIYKALDPTTGDEAFFGVGVFD